MTAGIQAFDPSLDLTQALLWQFNDAGRLQSLIAAKQAWYDDAQSQFWTDWERDVFDLTTANDFGLTVWGAILGIPLISAAPSDEGRPVFGYGTYNENFENGNFGRDPGSIVTLTTEQKRLILRLRYLQLVTRGAVVDVNAALSLIFADEGECYVLDGLNMTCEYVFKFFPSQAVLFVLENFDVLPRPAGVQFTILINPGDSFGFAPYYLNFNNGNFAG